MSRAFDTDLKGVLGLRITRLDVLHMSSRLVIENGCAYIIPNIFNYFQHVNVIPLDLSANSVIRMADIVLASLTSSEDVAIVVLLEHTILDLKVVKHAIVTVLGLWIISVMLLLVNVDAVLIHMEENVISAGQDFGDSPIVKDVIAMVMQIFVKPKQEFVSIVEIILLEIIANSVLRATMAIQE